MRQLAQRRAAPLQVLAVSGQPLVVSVTLPRFPFAKAGSPFATGGPRVRILLPPGESRVRNLKTTLLGGHGNRGRTDLPSPHLLGLEGLHLDCPPSLPACVSRGFRTPPFRPPSRFMLRRPMCDTHS